MPPHDRIAPLESDDLPIDSPPPPPPADDAPQVEHDRHWLEHVYTADKERQLTVRALITGCIIGGVMSFSNLYVGLKTGWGLGASITAAILAFALFSTWQKAVPNSKHFTTLENNTMQTAASSAAYMTSAGLVSAIPALYMVTGQSLGFGQTIIWLCGVSLLGIVAAIPVKRKLINQERLRFPSGIACAETLRSLHASGSEGVVKAQALLYAGLLGAAIALFRDGFEWLPAVIPVFGVALAALTVAVEPSLVMIGAGALMGLRVTIWMFIAAVGTWVVAPELLFDAGWLHCSRLGDDGVCGLNDIGYRDVTSWTLWPGVAVMVAHSLIGLLIESPRMIKGLMRTFAARKDGHAPSADVLDGIEIPTSWFLIGLALAGSLSIVLQYSFFNIPIPYGVLSVALALILAFVAARSTGETDVTPVGAMGKVTQLVFGGVLKGQVAPNLMAASVTGGAASQSADLLTDLKTGYLLGAKPRFQLVAQVAGALIGAVFATLAYDLLVDPTELGSEKWPAPAAVIWGAVAELLSAGLDSLESHKLLAMYFAGGFGALIAVIERLVPASARTWMPSVAGIGIAMMIPFFNVLSMLIGAVLAFIVARRAPRLHDRFTIVVASGLIAGETLMAVGVIAYGVLAG